MASILKTTIFALSVVGIALVVFPVMAQIGPLTGDQCSQLGINCPAPNTAAPSAPLIAFASNVINIFLTLVAIIAAAFMLIGAMRMITAQGNEGEVEKAKKTLLYAVIGLVVVGLAWSSTQIAPGVLVEFPILATQGSVGRLPLAILTIINVFLTLVALIAAIVLIIAGLRYITSQGNQETADQAKRSILYAIIGLLVVGLSFVVVNFVVVGVSGVSDQSQTVDP